MSIATKTFGRRGAARAAFVALLLVGCGKGVDAPSGTSAPKVVAGASGEAKTQAGDGAESSANAAIEMKVVDRAGYDAILAELPGKVVLVDFWASWCGPCLEQMPHTTALAARRRSDGLATVTVCMDDPDAAERLKKLLATRGGGATLNLLSSAGGGSRAMEAFEIEGGALPFYKLYDRSGELRAEFGVDPSAENQFTPEDVAAAVDKLLAE